MSAVDTKFYEKKKSSTFYIAIFFFLCVGVITAVLFFYNHQLEKNNADLTTKIKQLDASISNLQSDSNMQAYSIYERNQDFLQQLSEQSKISTFVSHLKKYFAIHGIDAKGFSYNSGMVSVNLSAQTNDNGYAYQKIVKFLREYNALGDKGLFTALFIPGFEGYDRINFTGQFKLK